jgi:hypothetical protein
MVKTTNIWGIQTIQCDVLLRNTRIKNISTSAPLVSESDIPVPGILFALNHFKLRL